MNGQQSRKNKTATRNFGLYEAIKELSDNEKDLILFQYNSIINDIYLRFQGKPEIQIVRYIHDKQNNSDNLVYHVKDATVGLLRQKGLYSLSIYQKDLNKRQEARKFLEGILS